MLILFLIALGFSFPDPQPEASCAEVLHQLHTEHRLEVVAAEAVEDTLVYLLADRARSKTVQLGCQLREP